MAAGNPHRDAMVAALKRHLVPGLRAKDFKGSFPHFRRVQVPRVDYLTVQFNTSGGSFVVEAATSSGDGKPQGYGSELPVEKLNTHYFRERFRLGSDPGNGVTDHWFQFGPRMHDPVAATHNEDYYARIAQEVLSAFENGGEKWLHSRSVAA
jgi:hypothetical protein